MASSLMKDSRFKAYKASGFDNFKKWKEWRDAQCGRSVVFPPSSVNGCFETINEMLDRFNVHQFTGARADDVDDVDVGDGSELTPPQYADKMDAADFVDEARNHFQGKVRKAQQARELELEMNALDEVQAKAQQGVANGNPAPSSRSDESQPNKA